MKTPMQEFITEIQDRFLLSINENLINSFLEKEKQQIISSYNKGQKDFANYDPERHGNECKNGEQYYQETFGDNPEAGI
jgi:hypothetical protein